MYELLDELEETIYSLQDALEVLQHYPEERSIIEEVYETLEEKKAQVQEAIAQREERENAALEDEYYRDIL